MSSLLIKNIGELLFCSAQNTSGLEVGKNCEILIESGRISKIASAGVIDDFEKGDVIDAEGCVVTPGLVDAHTHLLFFGTREEEFEMRVMGASYMEIAAKGGGIRRSVKMLRRANEEELIEHSLPYLDNMLRHGTTTAEVKSGYGLSTEDELKSLRAIKRLNEMHDVDLIPTFLGAHEIPDEFREDRESYINLIIEEMIPAVADEGLAEFCDVFTEEGVFSVEESERILTVAGNYGLEIKMHAEEFEPTGGAQLAAKLSAVSADHLVAITDEGIDSMFDAGVSPVLLPGTTFFLGSDKYAPAGRMIEKGLRPAIATDFNPGSCMTESLQIIMTIACIKLGLTPLEAIEGCTVNGARALAREGELGTLRDGTVADIAIWNAKDYREIPYHFGVNNVRMVIKNGRVAFS